MQKVLEYIQGYPAIGPKFYSDKYISVGINQLKRIFSLEFFILSLNTSSNFLLSASEKRFFQSPTIPVNM